MVESATPYKLIPLKMYDESLAKFDKQSEGKIRESVKETLARDPYDDNMLQNVIHIRGQKFVGLRHLKVGVRGSKGGAYVLYRICEECKKNGYFKASDIQCEFCSDNVGRHVVLFLVNRRGAGYDWL